MASNPRIDDLRKRLEKEPNSRLFAQLAEELRKDGEFEEAIRIARAGLARHPSYPSARMTLGRALFDTGDMASARQELQSVLEGAPDNILASRLLADCLEGLGDLEGALKRYRATLALSPGDKQITAHVRDLEGRLQSAARPSAPPSGAASTPEVVQAPIKLSTVDEPMVLETSHERHAPPAEAAPIAVAETTREFELETAYDAPGTQWRSPASAAVETVESTAATSPALLPVVPPEPAPPAPPPTFTPASFEVPIGERTVADDPEPLIAPESPAAAVPVEPARQAPPPPPPPPPPPMPPLPEPVAAAASAAPPSAAPPPRQDLPLPPLPAVVTSAPESAFKPFTRGESAPVPSAAAAAPATPQASPRVTSPADEGELVSPTLAELYFNQGFPEKAIEVYRRLLEREPANERARARMAELQAAASVPGASAPPAAESARPEARGAAEAEHARAARRQALERTIERLESLRTALQKGAR